MKAKVKMTIEMEFEVNEADRKHPLWDEKNLSLYYREALEYNLIQRTMMRHAVEAFRLCSEGKNESKEAQWLKAFETIKTTYKAKLV